MLLAILFLLLSLVALWAKDRLQDVGLVGAVFLAISGLSVYGWAGWGLEWLSALAMIAGGAGVVFLVRWYYSDFWLLRLDSLEDIAGGIAWAVVQQAVLLGFLLHVDPYFALLAFVVLHAPNRFLMLVTFLGGAVAVGASWAFGPSILAAALVHGMVSVVLKNSLPEWIHKNFGVGRDHE